ncbi:hypothetical protein E2P81_ATG07917 [Venturia nashicola]|uniref:Uncharacterized protein n=1 Tax=Venturia nashicola TaxID=86259 RepID=A0A4Z1NRB4_9PEZI|nr:hypothetical protein E6O75_ATG08090 [Venturia nashicola]TLD26105.1 hypothetical protein E2P81_ATG07917 [Venturia nashicola]
MNGAGSSPPSLPGRKKDEDNKDQIRDTCAADAQRESPTRTVTPTQARSDVTEMPSTPPGVPGGEAGAGSGAPTVTEPAVESEDETEAEPHDELQTFDWEALQERYHSMIHDQAVAEDQMWEEFTQLINYFAIWSETTQSHEVDRSFKRLKTRIHHVQSSEDEFEGKRKHYINVVEAFQSALALLNRA